MFRTHATRDESQNTSKDVARAFKAEADIIERIDFPVSDRAVPTAFVVFAGHKARCMCWRPAAEPIAGSAKSAESGRHATKWQAVAANAAAHTREQTAVQGCAEEVPCHCAQHQLPVHRGSADAFIEIWRLIPAQDHLRAIFCKAGSLSEVTIVKHESTGKNKGFAFVGYTNVFDAAKAVAECNGTTLHGSKRLIGDDEH